MAGISKITSSLFIVSQSSANFDDSVIVSESLDYNGIFIGSLIGDASQLVGTIPMKLFVGKAEGNPPTFDEWSVGGGGTHDVTITASGSGINLNHYTFIENRDGDWNVVSSGSNDGLQIKDTYQALNLSTGIYRYLVIAHSSSSKNTLVNGTTVTVNPEEFV